jgi:DNA/RNA endonuclease G (NUC1)
MLIIFPRRVYVDWAYLEDWCRRLTNSFADVYVFTIPLYLPQKGKDGKSRVVSGHICMG